MALTELERNTLLRELREQEAALREACQAWDQPTPPGAWSVAAIAEHLHKTDAMVRQLLESPALRLDDPAPVALSDDELFRRVARRGRAVEAPERLRPAWRWPAEADFCAADAAQRQALYAWIEETPLPLREGRCAHPFLGLLDGYQWLLFLAAHGRRHIAQINERLIDKREA
jgi:hypothetical protein